MKEQVSVDEETYEVLKELNHFCEFNGMTLRDLKKEYERLKRLDDNVSKYIKTYKSMLALNSKTRSLSLSEIEEILEDIVRNAK